MITAKTISNALERMGIIVLEEPSSLRIWYSNELAIALYHELKNDPDAYDQVIMEPPIDIQGNHMVIRGDLIITNLINDLMPANYTVQEVYANLQLDGNLIDVTKEENVTKED